MPILGSFGAGSARGLGLTACSGSKFVVATGGCESTDGDYKIHSFNASGCFTVTSAGLPSGCGGDGSYVDYLVVAAGGNGSDGGGGGGGMRSSNRTYPTSCGSAGCGPTAGIEVSVSNYPIVVGGIAGRTSPGGGGESSFSTITSSGGGAGGREPGGGHYANPGGSGGGGGHRAGSG